MKSELQKICKQSLLSNTRNVSIWFYWQINRRQNLKADWQSTFFSQSLPGLCNIKFLVKAERNLVRARVVFLMQLKGFYIYISRMRFMQHVDHVLINSHSNRRKLHDIGHKTMNTYSFFLTVINDWLTCATAQYM